MPNRLANSSTYRCRNLGSIWWNVPLYPSPTNAQNGSILPLRDNIPLTCTSFQTYSQSPWFTVWWLSRLPYDFSGMVSILAPFAMFDSINSRLTAKSPAPS